MCFISTKKKNQYASNMHANKQPVDTQNHFLN